MQEILDKILLSEKAGEEFYKNYKNPEFKNWLISILPEIEDCAKTEQDNPWHIYNVLGHILKSVEEMNKQTIYLDLKTKRMLAYTMFLHDIGKPQTKLRRYSKFYGKEVDSFFNHNIASVKIAEGVLDKFGFDKYEQKIVKQLIEDHDIFMFITLKDNKNPYHKVLTKELLNEHICRLDKIGNGKQLMKYLIMVGRADNKAQNPELTQEPLYKLEVMENMLNNTSSKTK